MPKKEEEKRFKREHQQPPKMDKKFSEDIGLKDEVMNEERQKRSKVLIVGGDDLNIMAISQLLP